MKLAIQPTGTMPNYDLTVNNVEVLDMFVDDGECQEIKVDYFLTSVKAEEIKSVLEKIVSKLHIGGVLTIVDIDFYLIANAYALDKTNLESVNNLLYTNPSQSAITIDIIEAILTHFGVTITQKFIGDKYNFVIKGTR